MCGLSGFWQTDAASGEELGAVVKRMTAEEEGGGWLMVQQGRPSPLKKVNDAPEQRKNNAYYDVYKKLNPQSISLMMNCLEIAKSYFSGKLGGDDRAPRWIDDG